MSLSFPPQQQFPCILACGYREIQSPRTALSFPAWLVQLSPSEKYWRSKKDFLLLFRVTKTASTIPQCPKAALSKLVNCAPWQRPGYETDINDSTVINAKSNYHVSMKRNLFQLDRYLQSIAEHHGIDDGALSTAWRLFARPYDTQGLVVISRQLTGMPVPAGATKNSDAVPQGHCEEEDKSLLELTSTQQGSKLGQYFCSNETAKKVVSLTLDFVKKSGSNKHVAFLEPSCGHGNIVWQLLEDIETQMPTKASLFDCSIIGCDLDPNAIRICQEHVKSEQVLEWTQGDFLQTQPPPTACSDDTLVVVLGGPPYTSGAGSGEAMKLDLPDAFLQHCVETWNASFVAFILPKRYRDCPMAISGWIVETHELEASTFYFQGERKVTQPSIIQCYTRKDT